MQEPTPEDLLRIDGSKDDLTTPMPIAGVPEGLFELTIKYYTLAAFKLEHHPDYKDMPHGVRFELLLAGRETGRYRLMDGSDGKTCLEEFKDGRYSVLVGPLEL